MLERRSGCIINIASMTSYRGFPRASLYGMSKFGIVSLTETMACEWADRGVRVNGIAPGAISWPENGMSESIKQNILEQIPLQRTGAPEDIASCAIYLVRDATYVTGQIIAVDGGRSLGW